MNKSLLKELPGLVKAGIISEETEHRIFEYFQEKHAAAPNPFTVILGILGVLLAGSGILLIVAHNWDDLTITVKTILSFIPLILAQAACTYTLLYQKDDKLWKECSSLFLFFAIGASIALISQVYQVNGTLGDFLLTWVLLALPLVYVLSASTVALFCIAGITWYAADTGYASRYSPVPFIYLVTIALLAPHYYKLYKTTPDGNFYHLLNWFLGISVTVTLGCFVKESNLFEWLFLLYCVLFCIYYYIGRSSFFQEKTSFRNPFLLIGVAGILITLLTWSFDFVWKEYKMPDRNQVFGNPLFYLIAAGVVTVIIMAVKDHSRRKETVPDPMGYSCFVLLVPLVFMKDIPSVAVFIVNAWTLFVAIFFIRKGSAQNHLGIVNFGLTIIAALALCRFFDDRIPFIWRGIFFLATGISFFAANYLLLRRRKQLIKSV